jgi:tRNA pseudouridine38-40 synthase
MKPLGGGPKASYRLLLEYDGSRYHGWQRQGERQTAQGVRTVAGSLERVLHEAGFKVLVLAGAGRTDIGVHATGQVAHLHLGGTKTPRISELQRALEEGLPADIALRAIAPCSPAFHARHDALERSYLYQLSLRRSAFAKPYIWWVKGRLDLQLLERAWKLFEGAHDMAAFADLEPGEDSRCQLRSCEFRLDGSLILLRVTARHFLRRQARRMVGAAVLCGLGRESLETLARDIQHPSAEATLHWAENASPSAGLFLERVRYSGDPDLPEPRPLFPVP